MRVRESQRAWQTRQSADLPPSVQGFLEEGHAKRFDPSGQTVPRAPESSSPWYVPNQWVVRVTAQLRAAKLWKAFNEEVIYTQAASCARLAGRMTEFERRCQFARASGLEPPEVKGTLSEEGCSARMADPLWWRRQFRTVWTRSAESGLRQLGLIRRDRQCYISDAAIGFRASMRRRVEGFLRNHELMSDQGEVLALQPVVDASLSNPKLRVGEMMCRLRGMEEYSIALGHTWVMLTLTCPSAFHPQLSKGGDNPLYNNTTVREAQQWLCRMWARVRAQFKKQELIAYGFRAAEPHHDGTPHWHVLLFGRVQTLGIFEGIVRRVWLSEYESEPGASLHRVHCIRADPTRGSAVGYLAKYIAKNVSRAPGQSGEDLEAGGAIHAGAVRAEDWSRIHGIRQFQQIGGPSIGIWREARRIRSEDDIEDSDIKAVWRVADRGDYCGFLRNVGGIHVGRRTNIRLKKVDQQRKNRYGEAKGACVVGLRYGSSVQITRTTEWRIKQCGTTLPPSAFSSWESSSGSTSASPTMTTTPPTPPWERAPASPHHRASPAGRMAPDRPRRPGADWWADKIARADTAAEARMWKILRIRSRGSTLGPVAITVTTHPKSASTDSAQNGPRIDPDTG